MTTATQRVVEMIRCMNAGERTTSLMIAGLIDDRISTISAVLWRFADRHEDHFIKQIGRLHRQGSAGRYIVVYEVINPDYGLKLRNRASEKCRTPGHPTYLTPCILPYLDEISGK